MNKFIFTCQKPVERAATRKAKGIYYFKQMTNEMSTINEEMKKQQCSYVRVD